MRQFRTFNTAPARPVARLVHGAIECGIKLATRAHSCPPAFKHAQGSGKELIQPVLDNQLKAASPLLVPARNTITHLPLEQVRRLEGRPVVWRGMGLSFGSA